MPFESKRDINDSFSNAVGPISMFWKLAKFAI